MELTLKSSAQNLCRYPLYKFGDKEYDEMHGLNWFDFNARFYNGIVPGFTTLDPLAEKYYSISPYAYCANNPIKYIDPDGRQIVLPPVFGMNPVMMGTNTPLLGVSDLVKVGTENVVKTGPTRTAVETVAKTSETTGNLGRVANGAKETGKGLTEQVKRFDGGKDTNNKTGNEALRNAKDQNGIPRSQQPEKTIKPNTEGGKNAGLDGRNVKQFEYKNAKGEKVSIRQDKPTTYPDGGGQPSHYNAGKSGGDLPQHHTYSQTGTTTQ
ncbi:MAG: hypothetical protein LBI82_08485 [Dysgonamonadaceae bacterium]|jgi:RHS repeat-associated protein|nr:hypothetical protein [Dysgonamonadaceae bacterium]